MELQIIRHKFARDYFEGFHSPDQVAIYSYQLQRMFESKAAVEGDYFLVRNNGRPYLRVEIYRTGTRRVWEKCFELAPDADSNEDSVKDALTLVFAFLSDNEYYFKPEEQLEVSVSDDWLNKNSVQSFLEEYRYEKFDELILFKMNLTENDVKMPVGVELFPFSKIEPEERFDMVSECDKMNKVFSFLPADKLYKDYMDESYESEDLWKKIFFKEKYAGFIMPSFTSAFKNELRLLNYCFKNDSKDIAEAALYEISRTGNERNVKDISFLVSSNDVMFCEILTEKGAEKINTFARYAKNEYDL